MGDRWRHQSRLSPMSHCIVWTNNGDLRPTSPTKTTIQGGQWDIALQTHIVYESRTMRDRADSRFVPSQWEMPLLCNDASHWLGTSLESASTRYVGGTPTSEVTPVTIRYIRPPLHGHTSQYHGHEWLSHSWDKAISDSDLETPRSRSRVWSKGKVLQSAQYHINSLPFHFTSIRPTIPERDLFQNLTLKHTRSRSWVGSKVKVTYCIQYPTNAFPIRFTSIGPNIPEIWPK